MSEPAVSVVVPARDAAATLPALLDALAAQDLAAAVEVLIVDDGSTDATAALARAHPVVTAVLDATAGDAAAGGMAQPARGTREPTGPGAARNVGIAAARAPVVAFTDADCVPVPGWLRAALAVDADVVQGTVVPAGPAGPWDRTLSVAGISPFFETANLVVRTSWLERVGGFERGIRPRRTKELGEDLWLGWRLRRAGARVAFAPDAVVAHAVHPRGPAGFVAERLRLRFFPALVRRVPELRGELLWRGLFLHRRAAAFDLALAGLLLGRRRRLARMLVLPYGRELWRLVAGAGKRGAIAAAPVHLAADAAGAAALAYGSVRHRAPVL